jgi:hypothetical protein
MTGRWQYAVRGAKLAGSLWPTLRAKIDRYGVDAEVPIPEIIQVVQDAYT